MDPRTDLAERAGRVLAALDDPIQPQWRRVVDAIGVFGGVELSALPRGTRERLLEVIAAVNQILARHKIETEEDYEKIAAEDLDELAGLVRGFAEVVSGDGS